VFFFGIVGFVSRSNTFNTKIANDAFLVANNTVKLFTLSSFNNFDAVYQQVHTKFLMPNFQQLCIGYIDRYMDCIGLIN